MTDRIHSCKESPNGKHVISTVTRGCLYCHRTLAYLLDQGWNVPSPDPDTLTPEEETRYSELALKHGL